MDHSISITQLKMEARWVQSQTETTPPFWPALSLRRMISLAPRQLKAILPKMARQMIEQISGRGRNAFLVNFLLGFGPSWFVLAFQVDEPIALLDGFFLNRLRNDWLQVGLTPWVP